MLAHDRVVFLQRNAVRVIALVFAGHVGKAGTGSGFQLDDGANIIACH